MKIHTFVSVVLYVHNEESSVRDYLSKINDFLGNNFKNYEIIAVNDASNDSTLQEIISAGKEIFAPLTLINLAWKQGSELGIKAGTDLAIGDFVFEIDSIYMDYKFDLFLKLYEKASTGFDIVSASPNKKLRASSVLFYKFINKVSYLNLDLTTERVRIISRRVLNSLAKSNERVRYRKILYKYSGFPSTLIKYNPNKGNGHSHNGSFAHRLFLAFDIILNFSNFGFHFASFLSLCFLLFSMLSAIYTLLIYFFQDKVVSGWTTTMLLLSFGFSGIFIVLTIISRYISLILFEIKNRPMYVIRSVERINNE